MVSSIVIGNASIDVIEGFQDQPGGAVTYVSNALIKLDHRVRAISVSYTHLTLPTTPYV